MADKSDPRTIITPYAFNVAPELLGIPLATPFQRLIALLIDLMLIVLLTSTGGLPLGIAAVIFFIWGSTRRSSRAALGKLFRVVIGCFGFVALGVTVLVVWAMSFVGSEEGQDLVTAAGFTSEASVEAADEAGDEDEVGVPLTLGELLGSGRQLGRLNGADTREEAQAAVESLARVGGDVLSTRDLRNALYDIMPDDRPWSDDKDEIIDAALAAIAPQPAVEVTEAATAVGTLTLDEALIEYGDRIRSGDTLGEDVVRMHALRERIQGEVAGDTLAALGQEIAEQRRDLDRAREQRQEMESQLEEAQQGSGLLRLVRDLLDETFLAFGWGTIYFTLFLTVLNGQTPGKKAMGIRVVQIDNKPLSWWASFERVGGYAAGLATGLLGFAQVFWDANRQAIHDKVSETVVIRTGAERVDGPWVTSPGPEAPFRAPSPLASPSPGSSSSTPSTPTPPEAGASGSG